MCGDEFGENVVAEVPPLPVFEGHYEPDGRRTQRLRFRFTKDGKESFIGHLDTLRLLERACRRASLPVSMTRSPYSSRPRISTAMALPLGASSEAEMMEIVLTERMNPEDVRARLAEELPAGMRLTEVEDMPVKYLNGRYMVRLVATFPSCEPLCFVFFSISLAVRHLSSPRSAPPHHSRRE